MGGTGTEHFSLAATMTALQQGLVTIVCRIGFDAAVHGFIVGLIIACVGLFLASKKQRYGKPLLSVARKIAIFCAVMAMPGAICLVTSGSLPPVNSLQLSSVGLIGFWSLVTLHLIMEEMNFQWFQQDTTIEG